MTPRRIQRKRAAGWRKPAGAICVDRSTRYGNPYYVGSWRPGAPAAGHVETVEEAVALYAKHIAPWLDLEPLRGHDLACWCKLEDEYGERAPCHADVLLILANE